MTQPENPNIQPDPQPLQSSAQNTTPEQGTPQFTGNEPAQQPYGAQSEPQINYGAQQNPESAAPFGGQPAYGTPSSGAPAGGVPSYGGQPGQPGPAGPASPAYGAPAQFPPQGGYDQYPPQGPTDKYNTMAIVGLILAILFPLVGLIISIVAMVNINKHGGSKSSKTLSLVGTIVGAVFSVASIILAVAILNNSETIVARIDSATKSPSVTQSQSANTTDSDSDGGKDSNTSGMTDSELADMQEQLLNGEITLEEAFKNPTVKRELEQQLADMPDGTNASVTAKGNTLICTIEMDPAITGSPAFSTETFDAAGKFMASQMNTNSSKVKFSVRYVITSGGKTVYDKAFTGE